MPSKHSLSYRDIYAQQWRVYQSTEIQPGERVLLEHIQRSGQSAAMLDLGVGAGRTTALFSNLVHRYVGIDCVPKMVEVCRQTYPDNERRQTRLGDACDLSGFADRSFDFVLFSYNGIDHLDFVSRTRAMGEIRRLLKPGGIFFFSSHSFSVLPFYPTGIPDWGANPRRWMARWREARWEKRFFAKVNAIATDPEAQRRGWAVVPDKIHGGQMEIVYIRPDVQVPLLEDLGFCVERVLDVEGRPVADLAQPGGGWWYSYLCRAQQGV